MLPNYNEFDRNIWEKELEDFVPESIFDIHTHIWSESFSKNNTQDTSRLRSEVNLKELHSWSLTLFPRRNLGYVILPTPLKDIDYSGQNEWVAAEARSAKAAGIPLPVIPGMLVVPGMSKEEISLRSERYGVKVLKPYRVFANDPKNAKITDFFPENLMEVADDQHLAVTLHLSMEKGPADEQNLKDLELFNKKYPNIRWILAHCARAFNSAHLEDAVHRLAKMENIFVDSSAVNDTYSHYLLFKYFDREKIFFGTDNIVAGSIHGKYIAFGYGWEEYTAKESLEHCDNRCTFVIYEQLRCQKQAAEMVGLTKNEISDLFFRNSLKFFSS